MNFFVMLKKETMEFIRTYKLLILFIVFFIFAIISPLTAYFMPDIMKMLLPEEIAENFSEPTAIAWGIWTVSYWISFLITYFYTWYYWKDETVNNLLISISHLWLFGIMLLSVILLGNVLFKSLFANLLFVAAFIVILFILSIFPDADSFNVLTLASKNVNILQEGFTLKDYMWNYITAITVSVLCTLFGIQYFKKRDV